MKKILILILYICPLLLHSQNNNDKEKFPAFNLGIGGSDEKLKNWGNYHFDNGLYSKALKTYEKIENPDAETLRNMAYSYEYTDNIDKAVESYEKIFDNKDLTEIPMDYFNLANLFDIVGNYSESTKLRKKYSRFVMKDSRSPLFQNDSLYYKSLQSGSDDYRLNNLSINSPASEIGSYAIRTNDGDGNKFLFTSSGETSKKIKGKFIRPEKPTYNLFLGDFNEEDLTLDNVEIVSGVANSEFHEGPGVLSEEGNEVIFSRSANSIGKNDALNLSIYKVALNGSTTSSEKGVPFNNNDYAVMHPSITPDGSRMYFASDMPGGLGGMDIYYVNIISDKKYSIPINMGPSVNTEGSDVFPYAFDDKTLFISSNGHPGLGGLDIFMIENVGQGGQNIKNLGAPFNSKRDDFSFFIDKMYKYGFLSSNRSGGVGDDDIYSFRVPTIKPSGMDDYYTVMAGDTLLMIDGGVLSNDIEIARSGVTDPLQLVGARSAVLASNPTIGTLEFNDNGSFRYVYSKEVSAVDSFTYKVKNRFIESDPITVKIKVFDPFAPVANEDAFVFDPRESLVVDDPGDGLLANDVDPGGDVLNSFVVKGPSYGNITLNGDGTFVYEPNQDIEFMSDTIYYAASDGFQTDTSLLVVSKLEVGVDLADLIEISPIYFDFDKFNISEASATELDKIVEVLNDYPNIKIELGSHTDCRGEDAYNLYLSQERARFSARYIQQRLADSENIDTTGEIISTFDERIYGKGYGESKPKIVCGSDCSVCNEEQHQLNRRTEFIVVELK